MPNFGHWYPRGRIAIGLFGYDRRGILDETHLRFFTRSTLRRLVRDAGFDVLEERATGLPLGTISEADGWRLRGMRRADDAAGPAAPDAVRLPVDHAADPARRGGPGCRGRMTALRPARTREEA